MLALGTQVILFSFFSLLRGVGEPGGHLSEGHLGDDGQHDFFSFGGVRVFPVFAEPGLQGAGALAHGVLGSGRIPKLVLVSVWVEGCVRKPCVLIPGLSLNSYCEPLNRRKQVYMSTCASERNECFFHSFVSIHWRNMSIKRGQIKENHI